MDPFLEMPNPYVKGNKRWLDMFYQPWVDAMRSADGGCYWVAPDTVGVGMLYNKDILNKAGVTSLPTTLGEFLTTCKKIQAAGYLAYLTPSEWYLICVVPSVIWADLIPQMDIDGNGIVSQMEQTRAIHKGMFRGNSDRLRELLRISYALSRFYPKTGRPSVERALYYFKNGKVAFMEGLSMQMKRIHDDPWRKFDYGIMPFPEITAQDSRYGGHPLAGGGISGYSSTWQVTYNAKNKGVLEACIDWLMFLTTPENCEFLVNEIGFTIPGVKGARPICLFEPLLDRTLEKLECPDYLDWHAFNPFIYTTEFWDNWERTNLSLALDMIDIPEAAKRVDFWLMRAYKSVIRKYGKEWKMDQW
jgi:ABC-type glycerol-3-phosphate transport system substrate-binding protein